MRDRWLTESSGVWIVALTIAFLVPIRPAQAQAGSSINKLIEGLGSPEARVREESRDRWSIPWLDILQQDMRYAARGLRRSPAFTFTVIATLGLGIGANAAMFGVIDRLMFRPFPYLGRPSEVHRVYFQSIDRGTLRYESGAEYTRFLDLKNWTSSFSSLTAISESQMAVGTGDASRERRGGDGEVSRPGP